MAHSLDGYLYPLDPRAGGFSGVLPAVRRTEVPTFSDHISLYWPAVLPDTVVREEWEQMDAAQFATFREKYLANGGGTLYWWSPGNGTTYRVEIIALEGTPYKANTYVRVRLALKIHEVIAE